MLLKIPKTAVRYWESMNATAFDSAVNSLIIYGGTAGAHQAAAEFNINVAALSLQQLLVVFLSAFAWGILNYLHDHPLEQLLPTDLVAPKPGEGKTIN